MEIIEQSTDVPEPTTLACLPFAISHSFCQTQRCLALATMLCAGLGIAGQRADAQVIRNWGTTTGGTYGFFGNWFPSGAPLPADTARFDIPTPDQVPVRFLNDTSAAELLVVDGDIAFNGAGVNGPRTVSYDTATIESTGELTLQHQFAGINLDVGGDLDVSGRLKVLNGASVSAVSLDASGDANIIVHGVGPDGSPSSLDVIGDIDSAGTLQITAGAQVQSPIGLSAGSFVLGGADEAGNPSRLDAGVGVTIRLASSVSGGAQLTSNGMQVTNGRLTVRDPGTVITTGAIVANDGGVVIERGARATSTTTSIGSAANHDGQFAVIGSTVPNTTTTWNNTGDVFVAGSSSAASNLDSQLFVGSATRVDIGGTLKIWDNGSVSVNTLSTLTVDRITNTDGGEFKMNNAGSTRGGTLQVNQFEGDLINDAGVLSPGGTGGGSTAVIGDYTHRDDAVLAIDIGGPFAGTDYDFVNASGIALINGQLELSLINGFTPQASDTFTIFNSANFLGTFGNVTNGQRLSVLGGLGSFRVNYGLGSFFADSQVVLSDFLATTALPGDYNADGTVNAADYSVWRDNKGSSVTLPGDTTPGTVTQADYVEWRTNFGSSVTTSASHIKSTTIPEPTTLAFLLIGMVSLLSTRSKSDKEN